VNTPFAERKEKVMIYINQVQYKKT